MLFLCTSLWSIFSFIVFNKFPLLIFIFSHHFSKISCQIQFHLHLHHLINYLNYYLSPDLFHLSFNRFRILLWFYHSFFSFYLNLLNLFPLINFKFIHILFFQMMTHCLINHPLLKILKNCFPLFYFLFFHLNYFHIDSSHLIN